MSFEGERLRDYVEVAERIAEFRAKHPEGSLQSCVLAWPTKELPFVVVEARAYRSPSDERPGVGLAWEPFPGKTPYTRDSELQNAETSAWGRAIVAALAADTRRGVASADEIRARTSGRSVSSWGSRKRAEPEVGSPGRPDATSDGPDAQGGRSGPSDSLTELLREAIDIWGSVGKVLAAARRLGSTAKRAEDISPELLHDMISNARDGR